MGILDRFKRKKKSELDEPSFRERAPEGRLMENIDNVRPQRPGDVGSQIELITSQLQSLRLQYEAINARLQNIERLVTEIRGFCK